MINEFGYFFDPFASFDRDKRLVPGNWTSKEFKADVFLAENIFPHRLPTVDIVE